MARVDIALNGRIYPIACADGEEERVRIVAALVEERIAQIRGARGAVTENHLLVMVCLMLGDELMDVREGLRAPDLPEAVPEAVAVRPDMHLPSPSPAEEVQAAEDAAAAPEDGPEPARETGEAGPDEAALQRALARLVDRVEDIAARVEAA